MKKIVEILVYTLPILFAIVVILVLTFGRGTYDRFITNINKDEVTARDLIYQTGSVRVYKFRDGSTICYVADKQGESTALYCK